MLKFEDFFKVDHPEKTKVKFNINDGDPKKKAWDILLKGETDPCWIAMNAHRTKSSSNNLDRADYLLAFAQYYLYGPQYFIFGGMYKVEIDNPEVYGAGGYKLTLMNDFADYRKRLIIKLEEPLGWQPVLSRRYVNVQGKLNPTVFELAPAEKMKRFEGYSNVLLTHE